MFGVFVFEKYLETPEQCAVFILSTFLLKPPDQLMALLPLSPWVDATLVRASTRRCQCQAGSPHILNLREDHGRVPHTSPVTTCWGRSSPGPGSRSPVPYRLFSLGLNASVWKWVGFLTPFTESSA